MRDSEVVAAIVAGDPGGLAEAYDKYAAPLYAYCRSLLREPADAADVVQDTFVIAASRLAGLRDQNRLRPWLYAVARNECYRRMRSASAHATAPLDTLPDTMPDVTDATVDVGGEAGREELRALLRAAIRGLNASDQDLIELQMQQGLGVAEIAAMLGVSRNHAHVLLSRARDQLETSLGALLVARTGREDCAALSAMLEGWDGQLTVLMRKRLNRHIERCLVCAERKRRELAPALLLGLAPLVALPITAMPAGLRAAVLKLASSDAPEAVAHRAVVAQRTALFGHTGFPKPLDPPKTPWWRTWQGQVTAGGAAAAVAAAVIGVALASGGPGHHAGQAALARGGAPSSTGAVSGGLPGTQSQPPHPTGLAGGVLPGSPGPAGGVLPGSPGPVAAGSPSPTSGGSAGAVAPSGPGASSASRSATSSPSSPGLTPSPEPSSRVTMGPNSPGPTVSTSTTAPPSSPPSSPGTLSVSPTSILLSVGGSATLSLTASNGPVNWSITESQALIGGLTVSPSSGTLASGSSTTVTVTASGPLTVGGQLTVQPGGITVTVVLSLNLGAPAPGPGAPPGLADLPARNGSW